jgi:hypothetical protein
MHTVELLEQAIDAAQRLGYGVRHEWLGGSGGGACEFGGRKWIFVDLALSAAEQLDQVVAALESDPALARLELPRALSSLLAARRRRAA